MKKIYTTIQNFLRKIMVGLAFGMKKTEDQFLHQTGLDEEVGSGIEEQVTENRVSKALLRGEVTAEVEDLRHRTYWVDREARNYDYFSPLLAVKLDSQDKINVNYENEDGLNIITAQANTPEVEGIEDSMKRLDSKDRVQELYTIKIERGFVSRYRIEEYTKLLVVKDAGEGHLVLDFYVSKYPNNQEFKSKGFVREVEKIKDENLRSDITDITRASFISSHAYKVPDNFAFSFKHLKFDKVVEFDGHYILRFNAEYEKNGIDILEKFYSERMAKRYANHEPRPSQIEFNPYAQENIRTYKCAKCGKIVQYDVSEMDALEPTEGRDIDDITEESSNVTAFMDMEMAEQTFGKKLCKECLAEEMANLKWAPHN